MTSAMTRTAKAHPEAQLAVKLYRQSLLHQTQSMAGVRFGLESREIEAGTVSDAAKLMSLARSLHRLYLSVCNDNLQGLRRTRRAVRIDNAKKATAEIITQYGLEASFNNDPRGYAIYIKFPDGASNSMGVEGWGI